MEKPSLEERKRESSFIIPVMIVISSPLIVAGVLTMLSLPIIPGVILGGLALLLPTTLITGACIARLSLCLENE